MSLVVWLPLVKEVKNQGISSAIISTASLSYAQGAYGNSANFNGHHIKIQNLPTFEKISISFRMKPTNTSQTGCMINYRTSVGGDLAVFLIGGKIRFDAGGVQTTFNYSYTTAWQHVVITYDRQNKNLYIDGVLKQSVALTTVINTTATSGTIGQSSTNTTNGSSNNYVGLLNDYRIYDHCLSLREIYYLSLGLAAHYKLGSDIWNGASGIITTVPDVSGNGHTITLSGGSLSTDSFKYERSLQFSSSVTLGATDSKLGGLFNTGIYTVSVVCKLVNPSTDYNTLFSIGTVATNNKSFNIRMSGPSLNVSHDINGTGTTVTATNTTSWNRITVTNDGTTTKLYINGNQATSGTLGIPSIDASATLRIGKLANNTYPTNGYIQDIRIYSTCFTADQVKDLSNTSAYIDNNGNVGCYEITEDSSQNNLLSPANQDVYKNQWNTSYLGRVTQINLQVTTEGYMARIQRTGNLSESGSANKDYGGIVIRNTNNILNLTKGHSYVFVCDIKGYSCTQLSNPSWVHTPGWNYNDGTIPLPTNQQFRNPIVAGYNNDDWNQLSYRFTINDDIYKVSAGQSGGHTAGETYLSYFGLMVGFLGYTTTTTGSDLYIKSLRLFDITSGLQGVNIDKRGLIICNQAIENDRNAFISCNGDISGNKLTEI